MTPQALQRLTRVLIFVQFLAILVVILATFAAVVVDVPLYAPMIFLGVVGVILVITSYQTRHTGFAIFGSSAVIFSLLYYISLYVLNLPLSPLYLFVLAYAVVALAWGIWLLSRPERRV